MEKQSKEEKKNCHKREIICLDVDSSVEGKKYFTTKNSPSSVLEDESSLLSDGNSQSTVTKEKICSSQSTPLKFRNNLNNLIELPDQEIFIASSSEDESDPPSPQKNVNSKISYDTKQYASMSDKMRTEKRKFPFKGPNIKNCQDRSSFSSSSDSDDPYLDPSFSLFGKSSMAKQAEKEYEQNDIKVNKDHSSLSFPVRKSEEINYSNPRQNIHSVNEETDQKDPLSSNRKRSVQKKRDANAINKTVYLYSSSSSSNLSCSSTEYENEAKSKKRKSDHDPLRNFDDESLSKDFDKKTKAKAENLSLPKTNRLQNVCKRDPPKEILILSSSDDESFSALKSPDKTPHKLSPMHFCQVNKNIQKASRAPNDAAKSLWSPASIDPHNTKFSDIMSPFATSPRPPPSNIPLTELPNVDQFKPSRIPTPPIPTLYQVGGKLYPDLRHQFLRALHKYALQNRHASHQRCTFDSTLRAILVLSLNDTPIRTPNALARKKGVGSELLKVVVEAEKQGRNGTPYIPPHGKFSVVAPAVLVTLLEYEENDKDGDGCCTAEDLLKRVERLVDFRRRGGFDQPMAYYLDRDTLDPDWGQIKKLCASNVNADVEPYIKQRSRKGRSASGIVFELLPQGRTVAKQLKSFLNATRPPLYGPLRQLASMTTYPEYESVTMCVDFREGGGGTNSLHKMCNLLDEHFVPYVVRELKISDYIFFVGNKLAPILIERKNVEDVASSLSDGRWERQQRNMRMAQFVLGGGESRKCQICYLIEGDVSRSTVHGGNVGRRSWDQSVQDVENAIAELPKLGFSIMCSRSHMGSMKLLAQIASDVSWKARNNSIDCSLTYDAFLRQMKNCDKKHGDPPTAPEHQFPAAPIATPGFYATAPQQSISTSKSTYLPGASVHSDDSQLEKFDEDMDHNETEESTERKLEFKKLEKLSLTELKARCKERDEKQSGSKVDLIKRILKPRKPEILIARSRRGQYVPKVPSCNAALMVALLLNQKPGSIGLTKENLMLLAEETGISKDPMGGNGGFYDGWSGMKDLTKGDPALVFVLKKRYSLTTQPMGSAGVDVAKALHVLAHRESLCRCNNFVDC